MENVQENFVLYAGLKGKGKLKMNLNWNRTIVVDIMYILIVDKHSGSSVSVFLNPNVKEYFLPLDFHGGHTTYVVHVYCLAIRQTELGRFYQLLGHSRKKLRVEETLVENSCVENTFNIGEAAIIKFPLRHNISKAETLHVTLDRCPPASYTIRTDSKSSSISLFIIFLKQLYKTFIFVLPTNQLHFLIPVELQTGAWSEFQVLCASKQDEKINHHMIAKTLIRSEKVIFKTYLSVEDYKKLYSLALDFISKKTTLQLKAIDYFYRNKSEEYFQNILSSTSGEMKPYLKDYNGDQGSVINGAINGVFFSTFLNSNFKPPPISFYGPCRLHLLSNIIFTENHNVYFADFYCHYEQHYVTIVMTLQGSKEDLFCNQFLLKLDKIDNPFLKIVNNNDGSRNVMSNMVLVVEMFYTDSIDIRSLIKKGYGYMSKCGLMGRGSTKPEGIPKNKDCRLCNL